MKWNMNQGNSGENKKSVTELVTERRELIPDGKKEFLEYHKTNQDFGHLIVRERTLRKWL